LIIPFYDLKGDVIFYQTRTIIEKDDGLPKYLGKSGGGKSVFGVEQVTSDLDYMFIFEGPIDSMFVKNGVAVGGVDLSQLQRDQLNQFPLHDKIWVLDNQHMDKTAMDTSRELLKAGERVYIWDKTVEYKDFNDICCAKKVNELSTDTLVKNSFTGVQGLFKLNK